MQTLLALLLLASCCLGSWPGKEGPAGAAAAAPLALPPRRLLLAAEPCAALPNASLVPTPSMHPVPGLSNLTAQGERTFNCSAGRPVPEGVSFGGTSAAFRFNASYPRSAPMNQTL